MTVFNFQWRQVTYPPFWTASNLNGSGGFPTPGGQQLLPDGSGIVLWVNGGNYTVYNAATDTWSASAALPGGSQPAAWSHPHEGRICFWDNTTGRIYSMLLGSSSFRTPGVSAVSYDSMLYPGFGGHGWILGGPRSGCNFMPSHAEKFYMVAQELNIGGRSSLVFFNIRDGAANWVVTVPDHILAQSNTATGSQPTGTGGASNMATLPGRLYDSGLDGGTGSHLYVDKVLLRGGLLDQITWADGARQTLFNILLPSVVCATADNPIEAALNAVGLSTLPFSMGSLAYTQGNLARGSGRLQAVTHVPFNTVQQSLGLPLQVATPVSFSSGNWTMFTFGGDPYILDDIGHFMRLDISAFDLNKLNLQNWLRLNGRTN